MGKFEKALYNNEIIAFFKGEGIYFSPDEMTRGYHCHMINWQLMMGYLKNKDDAFQLLVKYFRVYLNSLEDNVQDAWGLFKNIQCYYVLRNDNKGFSNSSNDLIELLDDKEKQKVGRLFRSLRDNFNDVPDSKNMNSLAIQYNFIIKKGCPYDFFSF